MAIALNGGDGTAGAQSSTGSSVTLSTFQVAAGSDTILLAFTTAQDSNHNNYPVTGITWNGGAEAFTKVRSDEAVGNVGTEIWYLLNPTAATDDVVASFTGTLGEKTVGALCLDGVNQATPEANNGATGSDDTPTVDVTTVADNAWVASVCAAEGSFSSINNSQTAFTGYPLTDQSFENAHAGYKGPVSPAAATTLSYTLSSGQPWSESTVSVAPAVSTGRTVISGARTVVSGARTVVSGARTVISGARTKIT